MLYIFMRFPYGKTKAVTLSYDDGCRWDIRLSEILNAHNIKCTFNLSSDRIGRDKWYLNKDEVKEFLIDKGHEIAIHGADHRAPGSQKPVAGIRDILNCRLSLEKEFGHIIRGMAYPDTGIRHFEGVTSYETIKNYLKELGIVYSRTLGNDNNTFLLPEDWYAWMPTAHHNNSELFQYIDQFIELNVDEVYISRRFPRLFYLWGHSYEFENDNNWDRIEQICSKVSEKDDVWYATNIEIYNYVNAYNSLIFSADETIVYNPTHFTIWFDIDGKLYSIKPAETLLL